MKVYRDEAGARQLLGRADIPDDVGPVYEVHLFGASSMIADHFTVGVITHLGVGPNDLRVERVILLAVGQRPEILPGWEPLAS